LRQQTQDHRREILLLLDGYDEAQKDLRTALAPFLEDPELHLLLTSRPGVTAQLTPERIVENVGFNNSQIETYCHRFFTRKADTPLIQQRLKGFLSALKSQIHLEQVSHIPLQLQMLCSLWEQG